MSAIAWSLTPIQGELFNLLVEREIVTRDAAMTVLYGLRSDPPEDKTLDAHIMLLRRKLTPYGVKILNKFGRGWSLQDRHRYKPEANADERTIAYNEGVVQTLERARATIAKLSEDVVADLWRETSERRAAYGIRAEQTMTDIEAGARALCVAVGIDPNKLVARNDGRDEEPTWKCRVDEARACLAAALARPDTPTPETRVEGSE